MANTKFFSALTIYGFIFFVASVNADLCKKFEKPEDAECDRKFCPLERIGVDGKPNRCRANKYV